MLSPEQNATAIPVRAENTGVGTQPLYQGVGDQNVLAGSHGTQHNHNIRLQNVINIERVDQLIQGSNKLQEPSRAAIIEWLMLQSELDFLDRHRRLLAEMVPGTGAWVLVTEEFRAWKDASSSSQLLWMHGILGSGKTMLVTRIIDSLKEEFGQNDDIACVYVYFQDGEDHQPTSADVFISLLKQLLQQQTSDDIIVEGLKTKYKYWCDRKILPNRATIEEYLDLFKAQVATFKKVYLIIDALDNFQDSPSEKLQHKLQDVIEQLPRNVRVLVSSRRSWHDRWGFRSYQELQVAPHDDDIEEYVNNRIENDRAIQQKIKEAIDPNFQYTITSEITKATRGMFLLTRLQVDYLCKQGTVGDIKRALYKLPDSIFSVFEASIQKLGESDGFPRRLAQHVLTWVIHAVTPLNVEQIRYSFAIQDGQEAFNQDDLPAEADLTSVCAGLVVIDSEARILRLVHESVQDHLQKHRLIPEHVDVDMAKKCLIYLLSDKPSDDVESPLLSYAATHWIDHLRRGRGENDSQAKALALKFLQNSAKVTNAFQAMAGTMSSSAFSGITGLHAAAYFSLQLSWAEHLIRDDMDVDASCLDGQTALHWAAKHGQTALTELLLQNSANPDLQDRNNDTPLHVALIWSMVDSTGVVQELVKGRARPDIRGRKGLTPLQWAIRYGPPQIAEMLVESQVDVNVEDEHGWTSLREAMDHGQYAIAKLLLERGADPNRASRKDGWTPLKNAVLRGDLPMVRLLVEKKADVNLLDQDNGYSPLRWAVLYKHTRLVELLIRYGANVNDRSKDGSTLLITAVRNQEQTTTWILLENGARPDDRDGSKSTALHHAITKGGRSIIWLLVTRNVDLTVRDLSGLTALDWAVEKDDLSLAWLLCANGATADAADGEGITVLHRASRLGRCEMVRFFLDGGTSINQGDGNRMTALHHAALGGHELVVALLASRGAKLDMQDARGSTALVLAILQKKQKSLQVLLDNGASCNLQDGGGLPALHRIINDSDSDMILLFGKRGADFDVRDSHGRTPLMFAAQLGKKLAVQHLLEGGANVYLQDEGGKTAWNYAGGYRDVTWLLGNAAQVKKGD